MAYVFPCQRFARGLAATGAWLGAKMVRYSFLVRLSHPLLHAGLSRRFPRPLFRYVEFILRWGEENNFHELRCLAMMES